MEPEEKYQLMWLRKGMRNCVCGFSSWVHRTFHVLPQPNSRKVENQIGNK